MKKLYLLLLLVLCLFASCVVSPLKLAAVEQGVVELGKINTVSYTAQVELVEGVTWDNPEAKTKYLKLMEQLQDSWDETYEGVMELFAVMKDQSRL